MAAFPRSGTRWKRSSLEGRTFDPDTGKDWEGGGIAPDVPVAADQALVEALLRSGLDRAQAEQINATVKPSGPMDRRPARPPVG